MYYNLTQKDISLCKSKKKASNKLIFALMLNYFKTHAFFPSINEITKSSELLSYIAQNITININSININIISPSTKEKYRSQIRQYLGCRIASSDDIKLLKEYLITNIIPSAPSDSTLITKARLYFIEHKIELVSEKELKRCIMEAQAKFEQDFFKQIFNNLNQDDIDLIDNILSLDKEEQLIEFAELKSDIAGAKLKNINGALEKIEFLSQIKLDKIAINSVNRRLLVKYYERILALAPSNILDFNRIEKYSTMAIFCHIKLELILDSLIDTMIILIRKIRTGAEKYVDSYIIDEVKRVGGKFDILETLALLNARNPKSIIEDKIYPEVSQEVLETLIYDLQNRGGRWYQTQVQEKMGKLYVHGSRSTLLLALKSLKILEDDYEYKNIIKAIDFINKYSEESYYKTIPPLIGVIPSNWYNMVFSAENYTLKIDKYNYELALLEQVKDYLGFKAIWVDKSYRYRNPEEDLVKDFYKKKESYCKLLGLPCSGKEFVDKLKSSLTKSLNDLNRDIPSNEFVKIRKSKSGGNISVTPSDPQKEPDNIIKLQKEISKQYSSIHLIDILKECDLRINFTKVFDTIGKSSSIDETDLQKRLLLCIFATGSNTGLKRMSIAGDDINYNDLRYVKSRYLNSINVRNAIRVVINNVISQRRKEVWGEATTTVSCDSTHIFAWDQNLMSGWHFRYRKKGVMIYWHVDKKSLCIYSQLKDCTSSEVGSMIKGVIEHDTQMDIDNVFVDTHGQSVIGFAMSHLLGFELCPRLKAINKQKLYYTNAGDRKKYSNIVNILKGCVNWDHIEENYDDIIKSTISIKEGAVTAPVMIKRFSNNNYNHPVYKSLVEIGKAVKTIFLCKYLSSTEHRIEINEGLNVVERLNNVMDFIFYGKLGQIKTNNTQDQELSILCLHLLQASMVYINTLIIQQTLSKQNWQGRLSKEDYRALTPLYSGHINPYGLFPLDFSKRLTIGEAA